MLDWGTRRDKIFRFWYVFWRLTSPSSPLVEVENENKE